MIFYVVFEVCSEYVGIGSCQKLIVVYMFVY